MDNAVSEGEEDENRIDESYEMDEFVTSDHQSLRDLSEEKEYGERNIETISLDE